MPKRLNQEFTHATFDQSAVATCLEDEGFASAFAASMQLLGTALLESPKTDDFAQALATLRGIDLAADWPFGDRERVARAARLVAAGRDEDEQELLVEYTRLFRGPARMPAPPWGSVYMDRDQVLYGWTWLELRSWLREHGITATYSENDPEDNFARLLCLAATLVQERPELLAEFLGDHLLCWSGHFLDLLEPGCRTSTYQGLACLAHATLDDVQDLMGIEPPHRRMHR